MDGLRISPSNCEFVSSYDIIVPPDLNFPLRPKYAMESPCKLWDEFCLGCKLSPGRDFHLPTVQTQIFVHSASTYVIAADLVKILVCTGLQFLSFSVETKQSTPENLVFHLYIPPEERIKSGPGFNCEEL